MRESEHPTILFIGCSDSRIVPHQLTGSGPGELFLVRNVGAFVPPYDGSEGFHGTTAAVEYAVQLLQVKHIIVCGHSHCGAIRALYQTPEELQAGSAHSIKSLHLHKWLQLGREAVLPVQISEEALRRTELRAIVLQLERLMDYPMVRAQVDAGKLSLHGWHYVLEDGEVHVFDAQKAAFIPASQSDHSGSNPYPSAVDFNS